MGGKPSMPIKADIKNDKDANDIDSCLDKTKFNQLMNTIIDNNEPTFRNDEIVTEFIHNAEAYLRQASKV
jgi:hypothetical protein